MPAIQTTKDALHYSYTSVFAPVSCAAVALFLIGVMCTHDAGIFAPGLGALFCGWAATVFVEKVRVDIDTQRGTISVLRIQFRGKEQFSVPLASLQVVSVQSSAGDEGLCYRACLETAKDVIPLTTSYASGDGARKTALRIHAWLKSQGVAVVLVDRQK